MSLVIPAHPLACETNITVAFLFLTRPGLCRTTGLVGPNDAKSP